MTRSKNMVSGKTAIGIVVCSYANGGGQAMALNPIGEYAWGTGEVGNKVSAYNPSNSLSSCTETNRILAAGNKSAHPAAWAAHEYSTEGTSAGDWCLPAAGIFTSYEQYRSEIKEGYDQVGGTMLIETDNRYSSSIAAWSTTERNSNFAYYGGNFDDTGLAEKSKSNKLYVFPVIEF